MSLPRYYALIPAAGIGLRLGAERPKQYVAIAGKPMLQHVLDTLAACPQIEHTYVVVSPDDQLIDELVLSDSSSVLRCGGATRQASVTQGLLAMGEQLASQLDANDWVLVHDAARPGLSPEMVTRLIEQVNGDAIGGLLAMPAVDTMKRSNQHLAMDESLRAKETLPRAQLWAAQTPQMFRHGALLKALQQATDSTDEASAMEAMGLFPQLVLGSARNFKVTRQEDIALAAWYLQSDANPSI